MDEAVVVRKRKVYCTQFTSSFRDNKQLTWQEKYLHMFMTNMAGQDGFAFPSIPKLAEMIGVSENTIRSTLKSLEQKGGLYICKRYNNATNKKQLSHRYYIIEPDHYSGEFDTDVLDVLKSRFPDKIVYENL